MQRDEVGDGAVEEPVVAVARRATQDQPQEHSGPGADWVPYHIEDQADGTQSGGAEEDRGRFLGDAEGGAGILGVGDPDVRKRGPLRSRLHIGHDEPLAYPVGDEEDRGRHREERAALKCLGPPRCGRVRAAVVQFARRSPIQSSSPTVTPSRSSGRSARSSTASVSADPAPPKRSSIRAHSPRAWWYSTIRSSILRP